MFCALRDQLASLGRHTQLTRCFSAVAELLVQPVIEHSVCIFFLSKYSPREGLGVGLAALATTTIEQETCCSRQFCCRRSCENVRRLWLGGLGKLDIIVIVILRVALE